MASHDDPLLKPSCMDGILHLRVSMNKVIGPQGPRAETQGLREDRIVFYPHYWLMLVIGSPYEIEGFNTKP